MAPLPVGQGSKEPARGGVLGVSSATSFFNEFPLPGPEVLGSAHQSIVGFVTNRPYWRSTRRLNVRRVRLREISRMALFRALLK